MLVAYVVKDGRLARIEVDCAELPSGTVWVDLLCPTRDEERTVERALGLELPRREEMQAIEISSRLYSEGDALFMTAQLLLKSERSEEPRVAKECVSRCIS